MDPSEPKKWSELLEWQRAWFEKGFEAGIPRFDGTREPLTPEQAYARAIQ